MGSGTGGWSLAVASPSRSSNGLPLLKPFSATVWSLLRHEIACQLLEKSARFTALRPRPPCSCPDPYFAPSFRPSSSIEHPRSSAAPLSSPGPRLRKSASFHALAGREDSNGIMVVFNRPVNFRRDTNHQYNCRNGVLPIGMRSSSPKFLADY